jgi:hypothetical protein
MTYLTNEQLALALGGDKVALRRRLYEARALLSKWALAYFSPREVCAFDFEKKRLVGLDGYYLQWQIRRNPDEPDSYENQQTSVGSVSLRKE